MANESAAAHEGEGHHPSKGLYVGIWVALLVLTTVTFGVSRFAPESYHLPAALLIATTKATLVALFFMHLKYSSGAIRLTLIISVGFVTILLMGILADVWTRFPLSSPLESNLSGVAERAIQAREAYGPLIEEPASHSSGAH